MVFYDIFHDFYVLTDFVFTRWSLTDTVPRFGLLRLRSTFRVLARLHAFVESTPVFGHSLPLSARPLVLQPRNLVSTDLKPCRARDMHERS